MSEVPARVRVTAPTRRSRPGRGRPGDHAGLDGLDGLEDLDGVDGPDAAGGLGGVYLTSLMRTQLGLAARVLALLLLAVGSVPLVFFLLPGLAGIDLLGVPLAWVVLGVGVYPVLVLLAWVFVRRAEHHERLFAELLARRDP